MHTFSSILLLPTLLISLVVSSPIRQTSNVITNLLVRAGGPAIVPIPSSCNITSPLPISPSQISPPQSYKPRVNVSSSEIYSYYLSPDSTANFTECLEQCYGFGDPGECKSAYMAQDVPAPPLFGAPGGSLSTACLMYNITLTKHDFVAVTNLTTYLKPKAGDIYC